MSNQPENEMQQTPIKEEVRQSLLAELEANKQAIHQLSDEELEAISGGLYIGKHPQGKDYHLLFGDGYGIFDLPIKTAQNMGKSLFRRG